MATTGNPLRVYTLDGLPAEVVAVAFAKTSRVPDSFDNIARELTEADSSRFHEKWVVGYGHSSVAEHAVLSLAVENVSILGAKMIEENRLSSFTEKSTRYQVMDPGNYYTPEVFAHGHLGRIYRKAVARLYEAYAKLLPSAERHCEDKYGNVECKEQGLNPAGKSCDTVRGLLPAAAKTNLGWTVNARELRHALVKMASSPLTEMREVAAALLEVGKARVPTLLKYTDASEYLQGWEERMAEAWADELTRAYYESDEKEDLALFVGAVEAPVARTSLGAALEGATPPPDVRLVEYDRRGERAVAAALLFREEGRPYEEIRTDLAGINMEEIGVLLIRALQGIGGHEAPVREFESTAYTFEMTCDFGAYRDIQRHRMTTQTQQFLTCDLGYSMPTDAREAGVAGEMAEALDAVVPAWRELANEDPVHAQYVVPLAFRKRFLMRMNYREAYQFVRLRSRVQGHESYRRIAWAVKDEITRVHPILGQLIPCDREEIGSAGGDDRGAGVQSGSDRETARAAAGETSG
ncbi:MAG: FAD-dependent thymidylate synthase [Candidatus Eisenbacteria bacterium]|nr:FAD-dependent thymidylate synthase [Candidatus Eisenbacteria bacterium]